MSKWERQAICIANIEGSEFNKLTMSDQSGESTDRLRENIFIKVDSKSSDKSKVERPHAGSLCPKCQEAYLDYDGLLNLRCPNCGYLVGGCFT